jgi:cell division protein FtsL
MSIDIEYAIKKDIRNNPVVREVDLQQKREFIRTITFGVVIVTMLLFSAWQHFQIVRNSYDIERLRQERAAAESLNRKLKLEVETLRAPQLLEQRALAELKMSRPSSKDTLVIERTAPASPDASIIATVR